jgi:hypothetical protein
LFSDSDDELFVLFSRTNCVGAKDSSVSFIILQNFLLSFQVAWPVKFLHFWLCMFPIFWLEGVEKEWDEWKEKTQLRKIL